MKTIRLLDSRKNLIRTVWVVGTPVAGGECSELSWLFRDCEELEAERETWPEAKRLSAGLLVLEELGEPAAELAGPTSRKSLTTLESMYGVERSSSEWVA